jgi:type I restriction enzyme S subunit
LWTGKKGPFVTAKVVRNTNIRANGVLSLDDVAEIEVEAKQFKSRQLNFGDIILEKSGGGPKQPVGRAVCFEMHDEDFSFSNFTAAITVADAKTLSLPLPGRP